MCFFSASIPHPGQKQKAVQGYSYSVFRRQVQQHPPALGQPVGGGAGKVLPHGALHHTGGGGPQRVARPAQPPGRKAQLPLAHRDPAAPQGGDTGPQIAGQPPFRSLQPHQGDDPPEGRRAEGHLGRGQHQRAALEKALGPEVARREGPAPVPLDVAPAAVKVKGPPVHHKPPGKGVGHAGHPVAALQKGHGAKGAHHVPGRGREGPEAHLARRGEARRIHRQAQPPFAEKVLPQRRPGPGGAHGALPGGEGDVPALPLGDELQRAAPGVHRRDEGQAAAGALALEVPAAEPSAEKFLPRRAFSVLFPETLHACLPLPPVFCRRLFF